MRTTVKLTAVLPLALLALACGRADPSAERAMSDDLRVDLELASGAGLELASPQPADPLKVVSALEGGPRSAPTPAKAAGVRSGRRPTPSPEPTESAELTEEPGEAPAEMPAETPAEEAPTTVADAAPSPAPAVIRPVPVPVSYPTAGNDPIVIGDAGRGPTRGEVAGAVIGVVLGAVLRGGEVGGPGVDDCERHDRPRRRGTLQGPVAINDRMPVIRPTFPRR